MMKVFSYSGKGKRTHNEDSSACRQLSNGSALLVVADGMGGYDCGAESAKIVVEAIAATFEADCSNDISSASANANIAVAEFKAQKGIEQTGCTVAGALVSDSEAKIFWAGDSRVYIVRGGAVVYQTEDHSLVNEMKKVRVLTPKQISKYEHIVRRAIMGDVADKLEEAIVSLMPGDEILVCSDGLYKGLPVETILMRLRKGIEQFELDDEKFEDNYSLIYAII